MAPTSTSCSEGSRQYPYHPYVNAASFMSVRLSDKCNYKSWKEQMTCLLEIHDMLGFINGALRNPEENNGSKRDCREWKRSDALAKGWIFGSLTENVMDTVLDLETANNVWNVLLENFSTPDTSEEEGFVTPDTSDSDEEDYGKYVPLCRDIETGNWAKVEGTLNLDEDALTNKLNCFGERTLHIAIGNPNNIILLENLLKQIQPKLLPTLVDENKENALHHAARLDNTEGAKKLVERNPDLLFIVDAENCLPVVRAVISTHKTTFLYLLKKCEYHIKRSEKKGLQNPFVGENGVLLLDNTIFAGFYDVAYDLLKKYPQLASTIGEEVQPPLFFIAEKSDAYLSAKQYNFYQRFVYAHVPAEKYYLDNTQNIKDQASLANMCQDIENQGTSINNLANMSQDIENQGTHMTNLANMSQDIENQGTDMTNLANMSQDIQNQGTNTANLANMSIQNYIYHVIKRLSRKFWNVALLHVRHVKQLHEDKVKHNTALKILTFICDEVSKQTSNHSKHYEDAFIAAVKNNTPEVIQMITKTFPESIWTKDSNDHTLPQLAITYRSEKAYNFLVHEVTQEKDFHKSRCDDDGNNLLHLAARLAPIYKLNMVSGAALQMQRELQWFQEVEKILRPKMREAKNDKQETPIMVFTQEHEDLRQKGEEWLKKTADSYTITAALIMTIVFAAAITVPGGNKEDTGKPTFETQSSFIIFAFSDGISMFTSTNSLLLFLSILTARYEKNDFLYKLPKRLILGLLMLFISVSTMIIAFSATLYIMFGHEKLWVFIVVGAFTLLPIASFMTLQLPLLYDLIFSTYGPGIFCVPPELSVKNNQHYRQNYTLLAS